MVSNNSATTFADTSTVSIASGAVLNLPNAATDIVGTLVLGTTTHTSGIFDSSTPGGYITGSGKIQVGAPAGYSSWALTNAGGQAANLDYDGDGVSNGVEYVLGGNKNTNDLGKLPQASTSSGNLVFTFVRDQASIDGTTTVTIDVGTNLATWPNSYTVGADTAGSTAGVTVAKNSPTTGKDTVTLSVAQSPDAKKFARLKVTAN